MYGEQTPDRIVDALRAVMAVRCNASVPWPSDPEGPTLSAVRTTIGRPVIRAALRHEEHPLLSVVRSRSRFEFMGNRRMRRSSFVVEWFAPRAPLDRIGDYWQMQVPVFEACIDALDGMLDGVDVLELAGVRDIPEESIDVVSNYVSSESSAYVFFQLRFDARHTPDGRALHETEGLPVLRELLANYLVAGRLPEDQPQITTLTRTTVGAAADVSSDDVLDEDFDP